MKQPHAWLAAALAIAVGPLLPSPVQAQDKDAMIREALSAAPASVADNATVMDWDQNELKAGTNGWTCMPSPPNIENGPMCLDGEWLSWAHAWMTKGPVEVESVGIAYMLQGDGGSSNTDPYAEGPTEDNEWVVEGPHLMLIVPDNEALKDLPTDPASGGPYVMWRGTPYAHVMIPVK